MNCRDIEGWSAISRLRDFDTTPCFEEGILLPLLLAAIFFISTLRSVLLFFKEPLERSPKSTRVLKAKLTLLAISFTTSLFNLGLIVTLHKQIAVLGWYILEPIVFLSIFIFTYYNHTRTRRSSTSLLLFWPLYIVTIVTWVRTFLIANVLPDPTLLALKIFTTFTGSIAYGFECLGSEMDLPQSDKLFKENPQFIANIYSIWTFSWMNPLMTKGASQFITERDLVPLKESDESANLGSDLQRALKKHSLWKALFIAYGSQYAIAAGLKVVQDLLTFLQPQLLRWILRYISLYQNARFNPDHNPPSNAEGFAIALLMFLAAIVQTICVNQHFQRTFETGMRVRAGLITVIYSKALVLSNDGRSRSTGDIVNLMSVDATRLQDCCAFGLMAISGPVQVVIAFISLYDLLGWAAFVGVAIMILSVPINIFMAHVLKHMQEQQMNNRDKRTRLMSEILSNIRTIKLFAWESTFIRRVFEVRNNQELKMLRKMGFVMACNMSLWLGIPLLVAFSSLATAAFLSTKPLTSDIIFPAITLFMLLQFPLGMFALVMSNFIESIVSIHRLSAYLAADELQPDARILCYKPLHAGDEVLSIRDADFSWSKNKSIEPTLEGINLSVRKGDLVGVLGRVGSGKSSLLAAVIGGMVRREGDVILYGSIAYASQNPWILSASIRDNILFSHEYDEIFYNLVIEGCALRPDLELMINGDLTEVGEKGITLSGGQRSRIALARAVYARADLTLLDDCLSAVDSHVARHIFDHVIGPDGLLSTKARILVTNNISFIDHFDSLLYVRRGIILEQGSYHSLVADPNSETAKLVRGHQTGSSGTNTPVAEGTVTSESDPESTINDHTSVLAEKSKHHHHQNSFRKARLAPSVDSHLQSAPLSKEHQEQGRVKIEVYAQYLQAASKFGFVLFLLITVAQQVLSVSATFVLRFWGEHNRESGGNGGMFEYLFLYGFFSFGSILLGALASIRLWVHCAVRSACRLHDSMLHALMHAPLSFFEMTPTGRILNLFSRDIYVVDQVLTRVIHTLCRTLANCLSIVIIIGYSFPLFLISVIPLGWFYLRVMRYYLATCRELKRIDAVTRSPIFAWFSETLAGLSTIHAFDQQSIFLVGNQRRLDHNQLCYFSSISVDRWLAVRLEFVGALLIFMVAVLAVLALVTRGVDAGLVGLILSYALNTTASLNWLVRSSGEVEQNIVSVERILHQSQEEPEAPHEIPSVKPNGVWPSDGVIEFKNYSTCYRSGSDLVLKDISIKINSGEKVGICGRTGAGKSSLLLALFRVIEPHSGSIYIDSVDITKVGLYDLRSILAVVPQNADLFEGTLRENIDPVGQYSDIDIWDTLDQVHLKSYVESLPDKLDTIVQEAGLSLSGGQCQLLCFARALVQKLRILVLDEATSSVDLDTDQAIQNIIRSPQFQDITIIAIAHRLNTIMDYDKILLLESGKIAEFDSPSALLANHTSLFYSFAKESGLV